MKKIAFFVEGQTEQIFVDKLVKELLGHDKITIITKRFVGGTNIPKQELVRNKSIARKSEFQILIYDCGADNRVKSEILEHLSSLSAEGYSYIVGIRDLYPLAMDELRNLERGLKYLPQNLRKNEHTFEIIIAVMEVETWFLAETNHLKKVDNRLTGSFIHKKLGFNPYTSNAMERRHPARDLNNIYQLVGKSYTKKNYQVQRLVNKLDFDHIIRHVKHDIPSLNKLIDILEKLKKE